MLFVHRPSLTCAHWPAVPSNTIKTGAAILFGWAPAANVTTCKSRKYQKLKSAKNENVQSLRFVCLSPTSKVCAPPRLLQKNLQNIFHKLWLVFCKSEVLVNIWHPSSRNIFAHRKAVSYSALRRRVSHVCYWVWATLTNNTGYRLQGFQISQNLTKIQRGVTGQGHCLEESVATPPYPWMITLKS